jgi:hypothetical protein
MASTSQLPSVLSRRSGKARARDVCAGILASMAGVSSHSRRTSLAARIAASTRNALGDGRRVRI